MPGPSKSRLEQAGGNMQLAAQRLQQEYEAGAKGWSQAQKDAFASGDPNVINRMLTQATTGSTGYKIGKVLKKAAPAAMFIPGIGPIAAAGIALAAHAGGQALEKGSISKVQPLKGLGAAAAAGAGNYGLDKLGGGGDFSGEGALDPLMGEGALTGGSGGGGGFWGDLAGLGKDALTKIGGGNPLIGAGTLLAGGLTASEQSKQRKAIEAAANYKNQLLARGLGQAEDVFASKAPLREGGMAAIGKYLANPRGHFQTPAAPSTPPVELGPAPPRPDKNGMKSLGALLARGQGGLS